MDDTANIAQAHMPIYDRLYREMDPAGQGIVSAPQAAAFLKRSNISVQTLGQIWEFADYQKRGALDRRGAFIAFKLVAATQQGHPIGQQVIYASLDPPSFASRTATPSLPAFGQQNGSACASPQPPMTAWGIEAAEQAKYDAIFDSLGPEAGKLPGAKVRPVLLNSGLNPASLAKIWELSDQDKDGQLDRIEMAVALHLVYKALQNEPVPSCLPPSLIHQSKTALSRRTSISSQSGMGMGMGYGPNRTRAGSMASLDGVGMPGTPTHGGEQPARSMSVQHQHPSGGYQRNGSVSGTPTHGMHTPVPVAPAPPLPPPSAAAPASDWPVDKAGCVQQFHQCDTDCDGLVGGGDVRDVMLQSGLAPQILAHIWQLADVKQNGQLNHEQFALAVHLIGMAQRREPLPNELPPQMVPPSLRPGGSAATPDVAASMTLEQLGSAAESEDPEVRALAEDMQRLLGEREEAEAKIAELEKHMADKNAHIKQLQIELSTLDGTVKQLERQKTEATKRLADMDGQVAALEAACEQQAKRAEEAQQRLDKLKEDAEQGEANAEKNTEQLSATRSELAELEAQGRALAGELAEEQKEMEGVVGELSKLERECEWTSAQQTRVSSATERLEGMRRELEAAVSAADPVDQLRANQHLFNPMADMTLLADSPPSTSDDLDVAGAAAQPADPFAARHNTQASDPFANADPFASAPSGGNFAAAFPSDPFANEDAFGGSAPAKPPPPRPAPPKAAPQADPFANADPFASSNPAAGGFADFSNFGAFS